jgi:hypothetical protein
MGVPLPREPSLEYAIDILPVPNVDDRNQNNIIMDLVDDPVITHPDAVQRRFFRTGKLLTAGWAGIFGEGTDGVVDGKDEATVAPG